MRGARIWHLSRLPRPARACFAHTLALYNAPSRARPPKVPASLSHTFRPILPFNINAYMFMRETDRERERLGLPIHMASAANVAAAETLGDELLNQGV